jgi:hypothetical protein
VSCTPIFLVYFLAILAVGIFTSLRGRGFHAKKQRPRAQGACCLKNGCGWTANMLENELNSMLAHSEARSRMTMIHVCFLLRNNHGAHDVHGSMYHS